jgi:hypothetical protein
LNGNQCIELAKREIDMPKPLGKFWPTVREQIWQKAEELFMVEQTRTLDLDVKPERCELREGGYFSAAKSIVLRSLFEQKKDNRFRVSKLTTNSLLLEDFS